MFSRVAHFYGMGYRDIMAMPVSAFWTMNAMVSRLQAETDMRQLTVAHAAQSGEATTQVRENLVIEMGEPVKVNPLAAERDEQGFQDLKSLANQ